MIPEERFSSSPNRSQRVRERRLPACSLLPCIFSGSQVYQTGVREEGSDIWVCPIRRTVRGLQSGRVVVQLGEQIGELRTRG